MLQSIVSAVLAFLLLGVCEARNPKVKPGVLVFLESHLDLVKGRNVGIISNPTGVLPDLTNDVDYIHANLKEKINLKAIFAPEQGFRGAAQAGQSDGAYDDEKTGIPVYSLYGNTSAEINEIFDTAGVDTILFDLQDVGARYYTYIWTMSDTMEGIAGTNKTLIVLDRPNPVNGLTVDGPLVESNYSSFVGRYPIPIQHGMTVGELAKLFNDKYVPNKTGGKTANIEVVWMDGWKRDMYYHDTGLQYVLPSVNLPTLNSVLNYVGTCLFEGTTMSEGRGTTHPFEILGAPWMDYHMADEMTKLDLPGVLFAESYFVPTFDKFEGETAVGIQIYITDRTKFSAIRTTLAIMLKAHELYPKDFAFTDSDFLLLAGSTYIKESVLSGKPVDEIVEGWQAELNGFKKLRRHYLHY
ncbi:hypothetical protein TRVA0_069S00188 [Trichomonascus vanleenenianus]|uniref:exo-beta-N-acetylmuramidase NamZ family protein n=1 Tax=Trichomonascus vanleenenianus TaxID=2268995 RepID=UPI003ECB87C8